MKPIKKRIVATINPGTEEEVSRKKEIPAPATSAVPIRRCRLSVWPKLIERDEFRGNRTFRVVYVSCGPVTILADLTAFTCQASLQS
jgi:hypothetical protein